jgi:hypothetical protein
VSASALLPDDLEVRGPRAMIVENGKTIGACDPVNCRQCAPPTPDKASLATAMKLPYG